MVLKLQDLAKALVVLNWRHGSELEGH